MSRSVALVLGRYLPSLDAVAQGTLRLAEALADQGAGPTIYTARASARAASAPIGVGALDARRIGPWVPSTLPALRP